MDKKYDNSLQGSDFREHLLAASILQAFRTIDSKDIYIDHEAQRIYWNGENLTHLEQKEMEIYYNNKCCDVYV